MYKRQLTLYPRSGQDTTPYIEAINNWYRETTVVVPCAEPTIEPVQAVVISVPSPLMPPPAPPPFPPPFPPKPPSPPSPLTPPDTTTSTTTEGAVPWWLVPLIAGIAAATVGACCCIFCIPAAVPATDCEKMPIWAHDPHHGSWLVDQVPVHRVPNNPVPHDHVGPNQHGVYRPIHPHANSKNDGRAVTPHDGMPYSMYGRRPDGHRRQ